MNTERSRQERIHRLAVSLLVVAVAFATPFLQSLRVFVGGTRPYALPQIAVTVAIVQMVLSLCVLSYVLFQRGLSLDDLGVRFRPSDIPVAAGLTILALLGSRFAYAGEWRLYSVLAGHAPFLRPYPSVLDAGMTPVVALFMVIDPFVEELIGRAFIIREAYSFTGRYWTGIVISVLVTTSYHLYEGWIALAPVATIFLVFAVYYARTRRAWPIIMAHLGYDLVAVAARLHMIGS
ncbi:MAG: CPBP family intramembrane glutamic endopeptidase [Acidiferrobacteraceae bacterium]